MLAANYLWNNGVVQGISFVPQTTSTYLVNVTSVDGCSSKDSLTINVNPVPAIPTITQNGLALLSSSATNNQWFSNGTPIAGATSQIYNVTASGFYSVQVSNNYGCKSMSTIINVGLGIEDNVNSSIIKVYPNPVSNELIIEIDGNQENLDFEILNSIGKVIYKGVLFDKTKVQTSDFAGGVYLIKINNGKTYQFKKIVKE